MFILKISALYIHMCLTKHIILQFKNISWGVPAVAQQLTNPTSIHEDVGLIPSLAHLVRGAPEIHTHNMGILRCRELWCRSQMQLGSCTAVALV